VAEAEFFLVDELYSLCISCHSSPEGLMHHPVQEMWEGQTLITEVEGVPGAHFGAGEDGPNCVSCHMPKLPTAEGGTRTSHTGQPLFPGQAALVPAAQDSCTACHAEQADAAAMQRLIEDTQNGVRSRVEALRAQVTADTAEWVIQALDFVAGDGSWGIHNYAYVDALLDAVETALNPATTQP
jgi:hypothetical protein